MVEAVESKRTTPQLKNAVEAAESNCAVPVHFKVFNHYATAVVFNRINRASNEPGNV